MYSDFQSQIMTLSNGVSHIESKRDAKVLEEKTEETISAKKQVYEFKPIEHE